MLSGPHCNSLSQPPPPPVLKPSIWLVPASPTQPRPQAPDSRADAVPRASAQDTVGQEQVRPDPRGREGDGSRGPTGWASAL